MSSSSSDSVDESIARLRQAVDSDLISDDMFSKDASSSATEGTSDKTPTAKAMPPAVKSQRYLDIDEIEADLNVPEPMQDFVYKKLSMKIADSVDFVEIEGSKKMKKKKKKQEDKSEVGPLVRLLNDTEPIKYLDVTEGDAVDWVKPAKCTKLDIKRKVIEPDQMDESEKIPAAAVEGADILAKRDTEAWKTKKSDKKKLFQYRERKSALHLVEEDNEFSQLRRKNNWDESKISKEKKKVGR